MAVVVAWLDGGGCVECSVVNSQAAAVAAASDGDGRTCTLYRIIIMGISMFST